MAFSISDIIANLKGEGARPTLFNVSIDIAPWISADVSRKLTFTCKAASLPQSTVGEILLPYFGRKVKVAGDRTYPDWTITIINDEDFLVRNALERWNQALNNPALNIRTDGATSSPSSYKAQAIVRQYAKTGEVVKSCQFQGLFPKDVGAIEVSWESTDQVEQYQVTFAYDMWEAV